MEAKRHRTAAVVEQEFPKTLYLHPDLGPGEEGQDASPHPGVKSLTIMSATNRDHLSFTLWCLIFL